MPKAVVGSSKVIVGGEKVRVGTFIDHWDNTVLQLEQVDASSMFLEPPVYGNALSFNGSSDEVKIYDAISLDIVNNITISAWIKPVGEGDNNQEILGKVSNTYGFVYDNLYDKLKAHLNTDEGWHWTQSSPVVNAIDGDFHHAIFSYGSDIVKFYWDNNLIKTDTTSTSGDILSTAGDVYIGSFNTIHFFNGIIDEPRIWERITTAEEKTYSWNSGNGMYNPKYLGGLMGWWHFNEGTGDTVYDETNNNNDGTISGASWTTGHVLLPRKLRLPEQIGT